MKKLIMAAIAITSTSAFAHLGGNVGPETGAVNVSIGKCTAYMLEVKEAKKNNIDPTTIVKPKGC